VSFEPVPAITVRSPPASSITTSSSASFSASLRVGDSPVVPATTTPSEPWSNRWRATARATSRSTLPSGRNGVTIAVMILPSETDMALQFPDALADSVAGSTGGIRRRGFRVYLYQKCARLLKEMPKGWARTCRCRA
jgi:hypothetical protein